MQGGLVEALSMHSHFFTGCLGILLGHHVCGSYRALTDDTRTHALYRLLHCKVRLGPPRMKSKSVSQRRQRARRAKRFMNEKRGV